MAAQDIIVVGAGQAGLQIVDSLRRGGYEGGLVLIGDEPDLPYQRPPLSKQFLSEDMDEQRLLFRPPDYYDKKNVEILIGATVNSIDVAARTVSVGEEQRSYHKLALATGASVRKLPVPGADLPGVCYLRSLSDARYIRQRLNEPGRRVVAIGGGFIGLEIAASARSFGHEVTVVEAQDRLMARAISPIVSTYYLGMHERNGVNIELNCGVEDIAQGADEKLIVGLSDGREIDADLVVVGIGSIPHTALAENAGLKCDNGIVVDECAQTSNEFVVAAGDCTYHRNLRNDAYTRLESVQNAVDQAKVAAANLLGKNDTYTQVPWFWSDQFDAKLQMTGTAEGFDEHVIRGDLATGAFSVFYFAESKLIGVDSVNRPADHLIGRKLLANGVAVPHDLVRDIELNLKSLL